MSRHRTIETGWTHPETEEDYRVTLEYSPGSPGHREEAPTGPEIWVRSVHEDRPGGAARPDLIPQVEAELDGAWWDDAADAIADAERDAYDDAQEDRYDSARDAIWDTVHSFVGRR
jgi:hypothetical protein